MTRAWTRLATCAALGLLVLGRFASADPAPLPFIQFDYNLLTLEYHEDPGRLLTVRDSAFSSASISLKDGMNLIDGPAVIGAGAFDLLLECTVGSAAEGYAMTGTFWATDVNTGSPAFEARFTSTRVELTSAYQGLLTIEGALSGIDGASILVNRAVGDDDWVYAGVGGSTVTVKNARPYTDGQLFQMTFGVDFTSLGVLFDQHDINQGDADAGFMHGTVIPCPAAVGLGLIGLSMVGAKFRRRAAGAA